ncbi:MAG TPA: RMD1 family protein [Bacillota bacterium]
MIFKAYAVTGEIDLNRIAAQCNLRKKYTWEEPLILQGESLITILGRGFHKNQQILVFAFGGIVFVNTASKDEKIFINYLKTFKPDLAEADYQTYHENYELRVNRQETEYSDDSPVFTDAYVVVPKLEPHHPELVATVIAKSVALEMTEAEMSRILDRLEEMIDRLERGNLRIGDKALAQATAQVIRHEYNTIAYIMILDKPDITWANSEAALLYDRMAKFFELESRYEIIKQKTDILNVLIGHFSAISHARRSLWIEWLVALLVLAEVILMVADLFK